MTEFAFWLAAAAIGYTFVGYPLVMRALARALPRPPLGPRGGDYRPRVSVVIVARDEGGTIARRIENVAAADYPIGLLEIIVASDGSTDGTAGAVAAHGGARLLDSGEARGKAACLNDAVDAARGEVVVFADARQHFEPGAIEALVRPFADPEVGAVSGELLIAAAESPVGSGIGGYWRMERSLRHDEARSGSSVGCTGAIYAIRRDLYRAIPHDTLLDDVVIPMLVAESGHRVLFARDAVAHDPQTQEPGRERARKQRTIAGNFQMLFRYPRWCLPWGHPLWWRLISHKYLRLLAPALLVLCLASNIAIAPGRPPYLALLGLQVLFYTLAAVGIAGALRRPRLLGLPAAFAFLNAMTVAGLFYYLRLLAGHRRSRW